MKRNWKAVAAAFVTALVVTLVGVMFFFRPIAAADPAPGHSPLPQALGFFIYVGLCVALFDWLARQMQGAAKAAFALAAAQFILIVDLALSGERGLLTLAAGGALLAVTWVCVAFVYSRFTSGKS